MTIYKTCSSCRQEKPGSAFYTDRTRPDRLHHRCKECQKAYVQRHESENPDRTAQYRKTTYQRQQAKKAVRRSIRGAAREAFRTDKGLPRYLRGLAGSLEVARS